INVIANIYRGFPGMVHTGAARAGVENMTMTLAVEWAQFGILVNAVAPGVILSSGTAQYGPQIMARAIKETPVKRAGTCEEVAAVARTVDELGGIDIVIANVGKSFARKADQLDDDDLANSLDANLWTAARIAQRAVPHMQAGGSITMISSVWGKEAGGAPGYN